MPEDISKILETKLEITDKNMKPHKPPLTFRRIMWQILAGVLAGAIGGTIGFFVGFSGPWWPVDSHEGEWAMGLSLLGVFVGYALASPIGVYLAGRIGNQTGSFWATFGSGILVAGIGFIIYPTCAILGTICAVIVFNRSRRYKYTPPS